MVQIGVNIAILEGGKVLLTLREDFEVWCLPGGQVEDGESLAQAARREAQEETGLDVELTSLVGIYSRPFWHHEGAHIAVFSARAVGGGLHPQPSEVLEVCYFDRDSLPDYLLFGQRRRVLDALEGRVGVVWTQEDVWPYSIDISRSEIYALRDRSGLSRREFYLQTFGQWDQHDDIREAALGDGSGAGELPR